MLGCVCAIPPLNRTLGFLPGSSSGLSHTALSPPSCKATPQSLGGSPRGLHLHLCAHGTPSLPPVSLLVSCWLPPWGWQVTGGTGPLFLHDKASRSFIPESPVAGTWRRGVWMLLGQPSHDPAEHLNNPLSGAPTSPILENDLGVLPPCTRTCRNGHLGMHFFIYFLFFKLFMQSSG